MGYCKYCPCNPVAVDNGTAFDSCNCALVKTQDGQQIGHVVGGLPKIESVRSSLCSDDIGQLDMRIECGPGRPRLKADISPIKYRYFMLEDATAIRRPYLEPIYYPPLWI